MSPRLAALRRSLDAMPSPVEDRPGLLLRDPFGYTEDAVIVPPRFLKATAPRRGILLRYEQWNIDPASVVSFAALAISRGAEAAPPGEGGA
jgi:hypothetical protein